MSYQAVLELAFHAYRRVNMGSTVPDNNRATRLWVTLSLYLAIALPIPLTIVVVAANFFLRGAVSVAHSLKLPEFLVGSVIVAIGTSAPEVAINVSAALEQQGDIIISNIVGSNIVNVALGVGIAAMILSFDRLRREYVHTLIIGLLGATALLVNTLMTGHAFGRSHFSTLFAAGLMIAFVGFMVHSIRNSSSDEEEEMPGDVPMGLAHCFYPVGCGGDGVLFRLYCCAGG